MRAAREPHAPDLAGCSKRSNSKAAASEEARRTLRYVEPLSAARTTLADFFSILLERIQRGYHKKRRKARLNYSKQFFRESSRRARTRSALEPVSRLRKRCGQARTSLVRTSSTIGKHRAGCSKRPDFSPAQPRRAETRRSAGKAAASEGPRRYRPHFVWAVRPCNGSWRTEKPPSSDSDI
jgi:hypothetical protein